MNKELMRQRAFWHNYYERSIYHVTMVTQDRRPVFGKLAFRRNGSARIALSKMGLALRKAWLAEGNPEKGIALLTFQVMPDHFHAIVFIKKTQSKPFGLFIQQFKIKVTEIYHQLGFTGKLWQDGFSDRILLDRGYLHRMEAYLCDNPRRLAIKKANPDLFKIVQDISLGQWHFASIGNLFLLENPIKCQVYVSRRITPEALEIKTKELLWAAQNGAVLVSPCISPGEKAIAKAAFDAGYPVIVIQENGFPQCYKPPGRYFDACAKGLLLLLAPWPYHTDQRVISREQCNALNEMARMICNPDPMDTR